MRHRHDPSITIFIVGGRPEVAELARRNVNARAGREIVVGTHAPPFSFEASPAEVDRTIRAVNESRATVLLVGLGGGRQEKFIVRHRDRFPHVKAFLPLGGTIDYEAGTLPRPRPWVTNAGLEWLYRVVKEPRARWHRYFVQQPPILFHIFRQRLGLYRDPFAAEPTQGSPA
jgi:exopolysaccharide biosynthesis WecB/TagA/CpsF family protein